MDIPEENSNWNVKYPMPQIIELNPQQQTIQTENKNGIKKEKNNEIFI